MQTWSSDEKTVCLSVHPSVCPSNSWFVTKRDNNVPTFLYHMKDHLPQFCDKKKVGGGRHLLPTILGQTDAAGAKSPIFSQYSFVAPQP